MYWKRQSTTTSIHEYKPLDFNSLKELAEKMGVIKPKVKDSLIGVNIGTIGSIDLPGQYASLLINRFSMPIHVPRLFPDIETSGLNRYSTEELRRELSKRLK